jgi:two-component system chemotaxis response regulator CheV
MGNRETVRKNDSVLSAGSKELEVIVFNLQWLEPESGQIMKTSYGINAGKVMELVAMPKEITEIRERGHASFKGVFLLRGKTIPLVDLCEWFDYRQDSADEIRQHWTVIVTEMNGKRFGFITHGVDKVHRITWEKITAPPDMIAGCRSITSICLIEGQIIQMVDFEQIISSVDPSLQLNTRLEETMKVSHFETNRGKTVVVADDSQTILHQMGEMLVQAGFQVTRFRDGQAAWEYLEKLRDHEDFRKEVDAVVSDIEMPRMDGFHLCSLIRSDAKLGQLPVLLFSSMINDVQRKKGRDVGATDQITKPEIAQLVQRLEACLTSS